MKRRDVKGKNEDLREGGEGGENRKKREKKKTQGGKGDEVIPNVKREKKSPIVG